MEADNFDFRPDSAPYDGGLNSLFSFHADEMFGGPGKIHTSLLHIFVMTSL